MDKLCRIYIAGHKGMVGSAILRKLKKEGFENLITRTSAELDLRNQNDVNLFFQKEKPEYVFLAAGKVGGIGANNTYRGEFIYDNLLIEANVINASRLNGVLKLLFLGSSCIYPKNAPQPLKESYLLQGYLEATNQPYAIAKIAGIEMCNAYRSQYGCNYISVMPTNLYGPNDNYDLNNSHVLPALIRKFIVAKKHNEASVTIWGSGKPRREFLYVDDLAEACLFLMLNYNNQEIINVGTGQDIAISDLAHMISEILEYKGSILYDLSKPDGTLRKLMDITQMSNLGWKPSVTLEEGIKNIIESVYDSF